MLRIIDNKFEALERLDRTVMYLLKSDTYTYILRFDKPLSISNKYGDRYHYVGKTTDIINRFFSHLSGGTVTTSRALQEGIKLSLVYVHQKDIEAKLTLRFQEYCPCDLCRNWRIENISYP